MQPASFVSESVNNTRLLRTDSDLIRVVLRLYDLRCKKFTAKAQEVITSIPTTFAPTHQLNLKIFYYSRFSGVRDRFRFYFQRRQLRKSF